MKPGWTENSAFRILTNSIAVVTRWRLPKSIWPREKHPTITDIKAVIGHLGQINNELIKTRSVLWSEHNYLGAYAVDDARNKIAAAMHDLKMANGKSK